MKKLMIFAMLFAITIGGLTSLYATETATVKGTVLDSASKSPVKAFVQLIPIKQGKFVILKTDDKGKFEQKIPVGKYYICVTSYGYFPYVYNNGLDSAVVKPAFGSNPIPFVDPITGLPLAPNCFGNGNGKPPTQQIVPSIVEFVANETKVFDIYLNKIPVPKYAFITGTVLDDTTKTSIEANISLVPLTSTSKPYCVKTHKGKFLEKVQVGQYIIQTSARGYVPEFYDNVSDPLKAKKVTINEGDTIKLSISLAKIIPPKFYTVSGIVTDTAGKPVQANIKVFGMNYKAIPYSHNNSRTSSTGYYSVKVKENDTVVIYAQPVKSELLPEYYDNKQELSEATRIPVTANVKDINFKLDPKPTYKNYVSGKVVSSTDEVLLAHIVLYNLTDKSIKAVKRSVFTDSITGAYTATNLVPGKYIALAIPEKGYLPSFYKANGTATLQWKLADTLTLAATTNLTGINFKLSARTDSGFVKINGKINSAFNGMVSKSNGALAYVVDFNGVVSAATMTDEKGNFSISGLVPGNYTVVVDKFGFTASAATQSFVVDYSNVTNGTSTFTLTENSAPTAVEQGSLTTVKNYQLYQNYPNPFNPTTSIKFELPQSGNIKLVVYNVLGKEVSTLVNEYRQAGVHNVSFDASNLSSGIYFYKLISNNFMTTKKMILMK